MRDHVSLRIQTRWKATLGALLKRVHNTYASFQVASTIIKAIHGTLKKKKTDQSSKIVLTCKRNASVSHPCPRVTMPLSCSKINVAHGCLELFIFFARQCTPHVEHENLSLLESY